MQESMHEVLTVFLSFPGIDRRGIEMEAKRVLVMAMEKSEKSAFWSRGDVHSAV